MKTSPPAAADVERFAALVRQRLGLHFDGSRLDALGDVLHERMAALGVDGPEPCFERVGAGFRDEVRALAEKLTVGETFFFRNPDQLRALGETVLPERLHAAAGRPLRLLSAGCASGEEPLTLAMVARERLGDAAPVSILGVDVNAAALARAERGRYSAWSLRQTAPELRERYFRSSGRDFAVDEAVRRLVAFEERNLVDDGDPWPAGSFDIIFCRNVIMYFAAETARAVVARLARALVPGGALFLGHAETLRQLSNAFHLCHTHDTFYYRRKSAAEEALPQAPEPGSWYDSIGRAAARIAALTDAHPVDEVARPTPPAAAGTALADSLALLQAERFTDALAALGALPAGTRAQPEAQLLEAVLLTNSGAYPAARAACEQLLARDEMSAGARYVMALLSEHAGALDDAIEHDRIAVYLDPGFAMPRLHLGVLLRRAGDRVHAVAELEQALELLAREDPSRILLFGGGFGREALLALCRAELRAGRGRP